MISNSLGLMLGAAIFATTCLSAELKLGIVGTDGSHAIEFTRILHEMPNGRARVVAAVKGGSPDLPNSIKRVDGFAQDLQKRWGIELVPDIATLCKRVDGVLVLSIDGRKHLNEVREVLRYGKPMFVDKPLADNLPDAREIARLAQQSKQMVWSSSPFRFSPEVKALKLPEAAMASSWGPGTLEPHFALDLSYDGIHAVEMLYTIFGPGVTEVVHSRTEHADLLVGRWKDGRIGTVNLVRPSAPWGAHVFANKSVTQTPSKLTSGYEAIVEQIVRAFESRQAPVDLNETLEIIQFLDAAQRSKEAGGRPVRLTQ